MFTVFSLLLIISEFRVFVFGQPYFGGECQLHGAYDNSEDVTYWKNGIAFFGTSVLKGLPGYEQDGKVVAIDLSQDEISLHEVIMKSNNATALNAMKKNFRGFGMYIDNSTQRLYVVSPYDCVCASNDSNFFEAHDTVAVFSIVESKNYPVPTLVYQFSLVFPDIENFNFQVYWNWNDLVITDSNEMYITRFGPFGMQSFPKRIYRCQWDESNRSSYIVDAHCSIAYDRQSAGLNGITTNEDKTKIWVNDIWTNTILVFNRTKAGLSWVKDIKLPTRVDNIEYDIASGDIFMGYGNAEPTYMVLRDGSKIENVFKINATSVLGEPYAVSTALEYGKRTVLGSAQATGILICDKKELPPPIKDSSNPAPSFEGNCQLHGAYNASEDVTHWKNGIVFFGTELMNPLSPNLPGDVIAIDLSQNEIVLHKLAMTFSEEKKEAFEKMKKNFGAHGMYIDNATQRLYVLIHNECVCSPTDPNYFEPYETITVFKIVEDKIQPMPSLDYQFSIKFPGFQNFGIANIWSWNDLVITELMEMYITRFGPMEGTDLENGYAANAIPKYLYRCKWDEAQISEAYFVDAQCDIAFHRTSLGLNGITTNEDKTKIWVNDLWARRIWVFDRSVDGLSWEKDINLPTNVDNIEYDIASGDIFMGSSGNGNSAEPTYMVLRDNSKLENVFKINATLILGEPYAVSATLEYGKWIVFGSYIHTGILICEKPMTPTMSSTAPTSPPTLATNGAILTSTQMAWSIFAIYILFLL